MVLRVLRFVQTFRVQSLTWIMASCIAVASPAVAEPVVAAAGPVAADTPEKTAAGVAFTLARGWSLEHSPSVSLLEPPESDTRVAVVDVDAAADAKTAAAKAWALYRPEAHRVVQLVALEAARDGWDERETISYETSPNERAFVLAFVLRQGIHWTVAIVDGSQATVGKRSAALMLMSQSVRPSGYNLETFAGRTAHTLDPARIDAVKVFVRTSMKKLGIPGAALALVDHGKVVFSGGFGVRELGQPAPVDGDTLFMVASNTKGMTTLLVAELVDEGKLRWDEPVTEAYPTFRLGSDATTKMVLIKHLVCACTGLPQRDLESIFNTNGSTPASATFDQLAATQPTSGFGEVFQYNNQMVAAAGYIGGHVLHPDMEIGAAYDAAMKAKVFDPLGMTRTTFDMSRALATDHASPHSDNIDGRPALVSNDLNYVSVPFRPAAGAWSSANDLIKYVQDELAQGELPNGERLVSADNLLMRRIPNVPTGENKHYGMGLEMDTSSGVLVVYHGGSLVGFQTNVVIIPDAQVGAVILTNSDQGQPLIGPFTRRLLELLYDGRPEAAGDVAAAAPRVKSELVAERRQLAIPPSASAVDGLAGSYSSPELGRLNVRRSGSGVMFDFGAWNTVVASRNNADGTMSFVAISPGVLSQGLEFLVASRQGKRALIVRDNQHEYTYLADN